MFARAGRVAAKGKEVTGFFRVLLCPGIEYGLAAEDAGKACRPSTIIIH